jgi:hypothetical protein
VDEHHNHMLEEGDQEAAIGAFLLAHEGHTQDVEVQRGAWTVYCRCALRRRPHLRGEQRGEGAGTRVAAVAGGV